MYIYIIKNNQYNEKIDFINISVLILYKDIHNLKINNNGIK